MLSLLIKKFLKGLSMTKIEISVNRRKPTKTFSYLNYIKLF